MSQATELIAQQYAQAANVKKVWGTIIFNVKDTIYVGGAVGNGTTDDTSAVQAAVNDAVSKNATLVFLPPGTYKVTALTNASTINFVGDNATFVGGYIGTITQFGVGSRLLSALTDVDFTVPPTNGQVLTYVSSSSKWKPKSSSAVVNLSDYGAKGDGTTDDTAAFNAAIAATTSKDVLFIPAPSVFYRLASGITINKGIRIVGNNMVATTAENTHIVFDASVTIGFKHTASDFHIENVSIKMLNTTTLVAAISLEPTVGDASNTQLRDLFIWLNGGVGKGVKGRNLTTSKFYNVRSFQGQHGFYLDTAGTSVIFEDCWAMSTTLEGYYLGSYTYCTFISCACDSPNNPNYAYHLASCIGISFIACGAEVMGKSMFNFDACNGISVDGCRAHTMNNTGTALGTFAEINGDSQGVVFTSCLDDTALTAGLPHIFASTATTHYPIVIGCNFFRFKYGNPGTLYADTLINRATVRIGSFSLFGQPFNGALTIGANNDFALAAQRLGVLKSDFSGYLGYIDLDGSLLIGAGTPIIKHISVVTPSQNFGSVPATSTAEVTVTVTGAAVGDSVTVTPNATLASGFVWSGYVSAADTVKIRVANVTVGALDPDSTGNTWRVDVWKH